MALQKFNLAALTTRQGVHDLMAGSASIEQWHLNTEMVKHANDGDLPRFWFDEVVLTGLRARTTQTWNSRGGA